MARERSSTWYVLSNLSYMKRVIILVFPTDWSPKNTSLYLAKGDTVAVCAPMPIDPMPLNLSSNSPHQTGTSSLLTSPLNTSPNRRKKKHGTTKPYLYPQFKIHTIPALPFLARILTSHPRIYTPLLALKLLAASSFPQPTCFHRSNTLLDLANPSSQPACLDPRDLAPKNARPIQDGNEDRENGDEGSWQRTRRFVAGARVRRAMAPWERTRTAQRRVSRDRHKTKTKANPQQQTTPQHKQKTTRNQLPSSLIIQF